MEGLTGTRGYEMVQELSNELGMTDVPQPHIYADTAVQTSQDDHTHWRQQYRLEEQRKRIRRTSPEWRT